MQYNLLFIRKQRQRKSVVYAFSILETYFFAAKTLKLKRVVGIVLEASTNETLGRWKTFKKSQTCTQRIIAKEPVLHAFQHTFEQVRPDLAKFNCFDKILKVFGKNI